MKTYKHFLAVVIFLCSTFLLAGCSLFINPEDILAEELELIKELDGEAIARYVTFEDLFDIDDEEELSDDTKDVFDIILKEFDYEILATEKESREATITVEITTIDMEDVVKEYMGTMIQYVMLQSINGEEETDINTLFSILKEVLDTDYDLTTYEVDFEMVREDGEWLILANDDIANALTGYFAEIAEDPYLLTPEEITEITLDTIKEMDDQTIYQFLIPGNILSDDGSPEAVLCEKIVEYFDYEIIDSEIDEDTAVVTVEITNIELTACLPRYEELITEYARNYGGVMPSEEEITETAQSCLTQALEECEQTAVFETEIALINDGSLWVLDTNEDFIDVMRGGLNDFRDAVIAMNE